MSDCVFKAGQEYRTRGGTRARVYATDAGGDYPVHGATQHFDGTWSERSWTAGGATLVGERNDVDLLPPEPEKVTRWVNVYPDGEYHAHITRVNADDCAGLDRIACIRITYHEGQYDE